MSTSLPPRATKDVSKGTSEATGRGRVVPSRYMNATASSRAAATSKAPSVQQKASSSTQGSVKAASLTSTRAKHVASSTTKPRIVPSKSSSLSVPRAPRQPPRPLADESSSPGLSSGFELEMASQLYSWLFMCHTISESSEAAKANAQAKLAARAKELEAEEEALADDRVRYQAERETQFIDELSYESVCRVAPPLIQKFIQSEEKSRKAILHATYTSSTRNDWNLPDMRMDLHNLEQLAKESSVLRDSITKLADTAAADSLLLHILDGLLRSLDVRLENLRLSKEILLKTRDNYMTACHLESLEIEGSS